MYGFDIWTFFFEVGFRVRIQISFLGGFGTIWTPFWEPLGLCFSVQGLPLWHVEFMCFLDGFQDLPKSRVGQKWRVIYVLSGPY